jgi:hypothetical protein
MVKNAQLVLSHTSLTQHGFVYKMNIIKYSNKHSYPTPSTFLPIRISPGKNIKRNAHFEISVSQGSEYVDDSLLGYSAV